MQKGARKMKAEKHKVLHPDFLGAHRYTTASGGIVRPAGGVLRTAVACLRQSKGEATLPLRRAGHTYPFVYFASDEALKSRASPSTKSALPPYHNRYLPKKRKVRCRHGY